MAEKYVTLPNDKKVHLYAESEFTLCGIPVPINAGASWTETEPDKVCDACAAVRKTSEKAAAKSTIYSTSNLGDISAPNQPDDTLVDEVPEQTEKAAPKSKSKA